MVAQRSTLFFGRRPLVAVLTLLAAIALLLVIAQSALAGGRPLTASLSGAAEVPNPGDPDGSGMAHVTVNPGQGQVCYTLQVSDIETATAAHIHEAPSGSPGPVVVALSAPADGSATGCVDGVSRDLAISLIQHPEQYYVNVHNGPFPGGALRGQLGK